MICIWCVSLWNLLKNRTEKLGKESLRECVSMETNKIIGDIEVSSDKFLAFSIPYSAGFPCLRRRKKRLIL